MKFPEVERGYKQDEVDAYLHMLVTEYEALQEELGSAQKEVRILKKKKKKLEEQNQRLEKRSRGNNDKDSLSYQETIAAAMMGAEASGKWMIEEAKKEVLSIKKSARREMHAIKKGKKEALREVKAITRKLQIFLKEEQEAQLAQSTNKK